MADPSESSSVAGCRLGASQYLPRSNCKGLWTGERQRVGDWAQVGRFHIADAPNACVLFLSAVPESRSNDFEARCASNGLLAIFRRLSPSAA